MKNLQIDHSQNQHTENINEQSKVFCFGSAQCDQFQIIYTNPETKEQQEFYQCKKPVEITQFIDLNLQISKLVCGSMHNLILTKNGQVYSWGRDGFAKHPHLANLPIQVDLISAGETHSAAANSQTGDLFIWGKFKGSESIVYQTQQIVHCDYYQLKKNGIKDIKSGMNHLLILAGHQVFCFGDNSLGALGNVFKDNDKISRVNPKDLTSLPQKRVSQIFTSYYSSYILTNVYSKKYKCQKQKVYSFGLNNYGQLGFKNTGDSNIVLQPVLIELPQDDEIIDIQGGEHHTLFLMKSGSVYGAGRNDDGQLGQVQETNFGCIKLLTHIQNVERIFCSSHFNYALKKEQKQYLAWGFGGDFVLANGQEDCLEIARPINNERVFTHFPLLLSLGSNHVCYVSEHIYTCQLNPIQKLRQKKIIIDNITNDIQMNSKKIVQ